MKRNPLYVFKDLNAVGIYAVPIESMVQVNDADDLTPGSQPLLVQVTAKNGLVAGSTIRDFLADETNYSNSSDTTEVHSELELVEQAGKQGWRLLGVDPLNYGSIGAKAMDLSIADSGSFGVPNGATGDNSFAVGYRAQAQNLYSTSIGFGTVANKDSMVVLGRFNVTTNPDSQFEIGIGMTDAARRTGFLVNNDGTVETPAIDNILIDSRGAKTLTTKEYVNQADDLKVDKAGDTMTGSLTIDGADLTAVKDGAGFYGNIYAENIIKIGVDANSKSRVAFNNDNGQNIYYDNARVGFFVDVTSNEGFKLWHEGNQGTNSGLDADTIDGFQPNELPVPDLVQAALNLKFDKVGGAISGNATIGGNLGVTGTTMLGGDVSINNIITPLNFQEDLHAVRTLIVEGLITSSTGYKVGKDGTGSSSIVFSDTIDANAKPKFYWENVAREFRIDTATSNGHKVLHLGNFDPATKLDIAGGTITGNLGVQGTLDIGGISTFIGNAVMQGSLTVQNGISAAGTVSSSGPLTAGGIFTANNISTLNGAVTAASTLSVAGTLSTTSDFSVVGTSTLGGPVNITGATTLVGNVTTTGTTILNGTVSATGNISTLGSVKIGIDANANSKILFTDQPTGEEPSFYWDKTAREFHVDGDANTVGGAFHIWHAGNFDPLDPNVIPQTFDDLNDTPAGKTGAANKFLAISADELSVEYVNIPDISALWGNITGDILNQADLITLFNEKFDKTGGIISGLVTFNGATTFNAPVNIDSELYVSGITTFEMGATVLFEDTIAVAGLSAFASEATFNGLIDANAGLEVLGTSNFTGDINVTADATISQTLSALDLSIGNSANISNTLHVNLTSNLDGVVNAGSSLTVTGATTLNNTLDVTGATDIYGATRIFNTLSVAQNGLFQLDATVGQDLSVGQDMSIAGNATIVGAVAAGSATISGNLTTAVSGITTINGVAYLNGLTTIDDDLIVTQDVAIAGTIDVSGAAVLENTLVVLGTSALSTTNINGLLDVAGNTSVIGTFSATSASTFSSTLMVLGATSINNTLLAQQAVTFQDTLDVDGDITAAANLAVTGTITQGGDGVATIDGSTGKIYTNQIPSIAITNVHVVADIPARDALTVETGDVAKVVDSGSGEPQTYIYDGAVWIDVQETSDVISVNGYRGTVVLTTSDVSEGSNLYYTEARVNSNIALKTTDDISEGVTSLYYTEARVDSNIALKTTDDISEGVTSLYYTNTRADARIASAVGVSVQAYDADLVSDASYVHTDANYTVADQSKLAGIEAGSTADQTKGDIDALLIDAATVNGLTVDTAVPAGALFTDTNTTYADVTLTTGGVLTDAQAVKFDGIATGAEVNAIAGAVIDIVIDGSETTAGNAAKINELLASLRLAGILAV